MDNTPIPYEYIAWKSIIKDIKPECYKAEDLVKTWANSELLQGSDNLYKFPDFENWFFEDDDHDAIKENIEKSKSISINKS